MDFPLSGRRYTWKRGNSRSKLDRYLGSHEWLTRFSELSVTWHYTNISDHIGVLLRLNAKQN